MSDSITAQLAEEADKEMPTFRRGKNVIAVASGKGGVGKTWFSVTPDPHALAKMGKKGIAVRRRSRSCQRRRAAGPYA